MELLRREDIGRHLNEASLLGAGVEVGAAGGEFSRHILSQWQGQSLVLVDCWLPQATENYIDINNCGVSEQDARKAACQAIARRDPRVRLLQAFSPQAASEFPDESLDWVYLDGNHSFQAVSADLAAWWPKVKPGGLFAGHDYLDGYIPNTGLFGVRTAVDRFARNLGQVASGAQYDGAFRSWYFRKRVAALPPPNSITVLTAYDARFAACGDVARDNHAAYCERYGYRYVCRRDGFDPTRPAPWSKLGFIAEELETASWVFWIDADAIFTNPTIPLATFVDDTVDVIITRLGPFVPEINSGAFFVRSTAWSKAFLTRWYQQSSFVEHIWWENAAIIYLHDLPVGPRYKPDRVPERIGDPDVRRHVSVIPHRHFNGMPHLEPVPADDFVAHFAGLPGSAELRASVLADWAARVEW